ncbi:unnamed protein product [Oncorhynchus mykiss]|uniref:Uncharacterized protein n=1 Tax=Oncorhynchus mykiss TaxID=8022 RepID=A0A060XB43_ONCMY|nr:unnamed protein product [Oncorhynchus mykiss]
MLELSVIVLFLLTLVGCLLLSVWAECCLHGWEQCLDMNEFYLGLIPQKETRGVESLEPFDAFEVSYSNLESCEYWMSGVSSSVSTPHSVSHPSPEAGAEPPPLAVRPVVGEMCVEGLGMPLGPGLVLLSGGSGWGGREDTTARVLIRAKGGWRCACVKSSNDWGVILYHTVTSVPGRGAVFGGRSSPLNPIRTLLRVTYDNASVRLSLKKMTCSGNPPQPRWRHTLTMAFSDLFLRGQNFLFVFGGRGRTFDAHFLCLDGQCWTEVFLKLCFCPYEGGAVICGCDLWMVGVLLGETVLLRPTTTGFCWERLHLQPPLVSRCGASTTQIQENNLTKRGSVALSLDADAKCHLSLLYTSSLLYPGLSCCTPSARHSFCSALLGDSDQSTTMALIGGEGNCFSVVTHHNPHPISVDLKPVL